MNDYTSVKFTKHAMSRARSRKLWKYVDRKKFYYDAKHIGPGQAQLEKCIYTYKYEGDFVKILTMYPIIRGN